MSLRISRKPKLEKGERFDLVIVGGGPAGLSAAVYVARFLLKSVVVTIDVGGQLNWTEWIDDYPGFSKIKASELTSKFREHAEGSGVRVVTGFEVVDIKKEGEEFRIISSGGNEIFAKAVILAVGSRRRKLGVPGEDRFQGRGVSYCSICDGPLYRGKRAVAVVGGGDAALEGAILLSGYVGKVYLIHRRDSFRAKPLLVEDAKSRENVEFVLNSVVTEILGEDEVKAVKVRGPKGEATLEVDGVFVEIGQEPPVELFRRTGLETDEQGYVKVGEWMETNIPGIFAAGDATSLWRGFRQVVTAAAMGSVAAYSAYQYLLEKGLIGGKR
ncbi:MAG: FAD-dependent oxidoreductase [Acidilobaceae archaeon]|nr:FAD-dependent oxidoreductase [Acidilobaceae archaeon]MCX8165019.1 FAD-dependent oxidoreductase [Acidilobaceae archaeon]MDW7974464.1 FAD-dependent oxidoreductase [Sulfolobales archaeon]